MKGIDVLKMKPTFIEENGKPKFVVFSMKDFKAITEALEDAYDVRLIRESRRESAGKPTISHEQMLRELGMTHLLKNRKSSRSSGANGATKLPRRAAKTRS